MMKEGNVCVKLQECVDLTKAGLQDEATSAC